MKSAIFWDLILKLPDGSIERCPARDRSDAEETYKKLHGLNNNIRGQLFKLKLVGKRLFVEEVILRKEGTHAPVPLTERGSKSKERDEEQPSAESHPTATV